MGEYSLLPPWAVASVDTFDHEESQGAGGQMFEASSNSA
jgi:hypothetical protein